MNAKLNTVEGLGQERVARANKAGPNSDEESEADSSRSPRAARSKRDLTILVVEDQDGLRRLIARFLRSSGYFVEAARDGAEGLEKAKDLEALDLVISDMKMPLVSGPELVKALRRRQPDLKVLFISGSPEEFGKVDLSDRRQTRLLRKPFTPMQLFSQVQALLGQQ